MSKPYINGAATPVPAPAAPQSPVVPQTVAEQVWQDVSMRHAEYLANLSAAHTAYMNMATALMTGSALSQPVQLAALPAPRPAPQPAPVVTPSPAPAATPVPPPAPVAQQAAAMPQPAAMPAPAPTRSSATVSEEAKPAAPATASVTPAASDSDNVALVRAIISEKTGYPEDMLELDMDLEGELGVDSIKQVEILSTLRERVPELPEIDPERLVELRTISAIAAMMDGSTPASTPVAMPTSVAAAPVVTRPDPRPAPAPVTEAASSVSNGRISADAVRELIAEKTGYPTDMLEDDMDLEGELGVDSIKQVEILSALREQHPDLPEVDPESLTELRTIRNIADFFA